MVVVEEVAHTPMLVYLVWVVTQYKVIHFGMGKNLFKEVMMGEVGIRSAQVLEVVQEGEQIDTEEVMVFKLILLE